MSEVKPVAGAGAAVVVDKQVLEQSASLPGRLSRWLTAPLRLTSVIAARLASRAGGGSGSAGLGDWVKSLLGSRAGKSAAGSGTAPAR